VTLFRFNKKTEALGKLDAAIPMVTDIVDSRVSRQQREGLLRGIRKLRDCLDRTPMPKLSRLRIRAVLDDGSSRRLVDAEIRVDGMTVGRTGRNGVLSTPVPSGKLSLRALIPPYTFGSYDITLAPDVARSLTIEVSDDKEVGEYTTPVIVEAIEDVVPANSRTLTVKFHGEEGLARVSGIDDIELRDSLGNFARDLTDAFEVVDGGIVARDAQKLLKERGQSGETISIRLIGHDIAEFFHSEP
jgi:hypothetical protein